MRILKEIIILMLLYIIINGCNTKVKIFSKNDINLIPKPASLQLNSGFFIFTKDTKFFVIDSIQKKLSQILIDKFKKVTSWNLETTTKIPIKNYVQFKIAKNLKKEVYNLKVTENNITILASGFSGFLYGIETIRQLLPVAIESKTEIKKIAWQIPNVEIKDQPRFKWRGLMLDISRHFFGKEYIKEVIDGLAMHKMNVLHLHLVDDQGWRIEIKKYPKLTQVGAWNSRLAINPKVKGTNDGFLTQEDLKEIIKYGQSKNIEIIPEIELPAHSAVAIASYPYLSCFKKPIETNVYCPGKETTFQFLEDVLVEVMNIFPSKYIHIGGDEATKTNWTNCPYCQKRMKEEGLNNVEELQSYFVKRIGLFINSHGKKLIGWDEILEGGLASGATVMSWRGVKGGLEATSQGHDVVMTPGDYCYFDHYQGPQNEEPLAIGGFLPLSKVYQFDPVVKTMTVEEAHHVLGGQANLWAEYISTKEHSQYMIYPRLAALSEVLWSPKKICDWDNFSNRIIPMFKRYNYLGLNYAKSAYLVTVNTTVNLKRKLVNITLQNEFRHADIRYILGDNNLSKKAIKYTKPIEFNKTTIIKASLFKNNKQVGKIFIDTIKFHKAVAHKVTYNIPYNDKYQGAGMYGLVNTLRGTKNFQDGQWQAWLGKNMEVVIDLENEQSIHQVTVGSMENQGPDIYFPVTIEVFVSDNSHSYEKVGEIERPFAINTKSELKDFKISFKERNTRFVKVKATNLKRSIKGRKSWLFIDEILID